MASSPTSHGKEQRSARRLPLRLPITITYPNAGSPRMLTETENVSSAGVFLYINSEIPAGSKLEFVLTLPTEITLTECIRIRCEGTVVRTDRSANGSLVGVAAAIDRYDFLTGKSGESWQR